MKIKTLLVALCAMCIPFAAFAYDGKELKFGVDSAYPPFESKTPSGELVGFDIDLGNAICAKAIGFSHKIYANFEALVVRDGSALVAMPESLNEKHIGVLQGSTQEAYMHGSIGRMELTLCPTLRKTRCGMTSRVGGSMRHWFRGRRLSRDS